MSATPSTPLLETLADSVAACLDTTSAEALANLQLDPGTRERLDELADKANEGQLTPQERAEYQSFIGINEFLGLAQLRARARRDVTISTRNGPNRPAVCEAMIRDSGEGTFAPFRPERPEEFSPGLRPKADALGNEDEYHRPA